MAIISLANDFSQFPGGRFRSDGPFSGEVFRDDVLLPLLRKALASNQTLTLVLDGVAGLPSSFLEEGFGGILRKAPEISARELLITLKFEFKNPLFQRYVTMISDYVTRAERAKQKA
jgi:hypothetical protein